MSKKKIVSFVLVLSLLLSVFGGVITKAVQDPVQSDKAKLLAAIGNTAQSDRIEIVKAIAAAESNNYTPTGNYSFIEASFTTNIDATVDTIWTELGASESIIKKATLKSGLQQFHTFYTENPELAEFIIAQLTGTLTNVSTPAGLGSLRTEIEEYAGTYSLFINSLLYLKEYINQEPLEQTADGSIELSSVVTGLEELYFSIGFDSGRLTAYKNKLTDLFNKTKSWSVVSERNALINDLIAQGVALEYNAGSPVYVAPNPNPTPTPTTAPAPTPTAAPAPTPAPAAETIAVKPPVVDASGTAAVEVPKAVLENALSKAVPAADGVKTVIVQVAEVAGAKSYAPQLPSSVLSSGDKLERILLDTPVADLTVPGNMLTSADVGSADSVKLVVGIADASGIKNEEVKAKIGNRPVVELKVEVNGVQRAWNNQNAPVTVSVKYTPTAEELKNTDFLTIYYIDGAGNFIAVPNARYNAATGSIDFTTTHFSKYAVAYSYKIFIDLAKYAWAKTSVDVVASNGILEGISESVFSPQTVISRDEFLAAIVRAYGLTAAADANFSDVKPSNKYCNEIAIAKKLGITAGIGNNKFGTNTSIKRQDMMALIVRVLKYMNKLGAAGSDSDIVKFTDKAKVGSYAKDSVATCVKNGIIVGSGNAINPLGNMTKAEAAVVLYKIIKK